MYQWQWGVIWQYREVFLQGVLITLWLTFLVVIVGSILGLFVGLLRRSTLPLIPQLAQIYTGLFRGIPTLVLLILIYYVLPSLLGLRFSPFVVAFIGLTLNLSAYVAETVRASIEAIPRHQFESGLTLGLTPSQVMFSMILPQAFRSMIPNLLGLYIVELKNSSLASVIAVDELLHRSNSVISNSYRPMEVYTMVAVIYLAIVLPATYLSNKLEKKLAHKTKNI